jgi:hypothetical protein
MQAVNIVELQATNVEEVEAVLIDGIIAGYLGKIKDTSETFKSQVLQLIRLYHRFGSYEELYKRTSSNPCWGNGWEWNERKFAHGQFPLVVISQASSWFTNKHLVSSFVGQCQGLKFQLSQEPKAPRDGFYYFPVNA